jgi:XTP/dITP diphosphohydrolase
MSGAPVTNAVPALDGTRAAGAETTAGAAAGFAELVAVMDRLRSPGGCPWDAEQSAESLLPYLVEESYELVEAVESGARAHIVEELGDVLLQVVFQARVGQEGEEPFDVGDVVRGLTGKLRRRHPHVFAVPEGAAPATVASVEGSWERLKREEKSERESVFDGMPAALPALSRAQKVLRKARRTGLRVDVPEERPPGSGGPAEYSPEEIGARLLALVAAAERQGIDAESALRRSVAGAEAAARAEESGRGGTR